MRKPTEQDLAEARKRERGTKPWVTEAKTNGLPLVITAPEDTPNLNAGRALAAHYGWRARKINDNELLIEDKETTS